MTPPAYHEELGIPPFDDQPVLLLYKQCKAMEHHAGYDAWLTYNRIADELLAELGSGRWTVEMSAYNGLWLPVEPWRQWRAPWK